MKWEGGKAQAWVAHAKGCCLDRYMTRGALRSNPTLVRVLGICLLFLAQIGAGKGARAITTDPNDPLITCSETMEGEATHTVALRSFRPLEYLNSTLPTLPSANAEIVKTMLEYPRGTTHAYWWPKKKEVAYDGCTTDIFLNGRRVMRGESKGRTYCCGMTLEVFYRVFGSHPEAQQILSTQSATDQFKRLWFCTGMNSPGPLDALASVGIGRRIINFDDALPGDFVQIWRPNRSGHSVVFVAWARDPGGQVVGIHYWSSNESQKGITFATELFGKKYRSVLRDQLSIARVELK